MKLKLFSFRGIFLRLTANISAVHANRKEYTLIHTNAVNKNSPVLLIPISLTQSQFLHKLSLLKSWNSREDYQWAVLNSGSVATTLKPGCIRFMVRIG